MKRVYKANLSLAIALTIASSVAPYAMAEYPVFSLTKGETVDLEHRKVQCMGLMQII